MSFNIWYPYLPFNFLGCLESQVSKKVTCAMYVYQTGEIPFPTLPRGLHKSRLLFRSRHFAGFFRLKFGWRFKTPPLWMWSCGVFVGPEKILPKLKDVMFLRIRGGENLCFPFKRGPASYLSQKSKSLKDFDDLGTTWGGWDPWQSINTHKFPEVSGGISTHHCPMSPKKNHATHQLNALGEFVPIETPGHSWIQHSWFQFRKARDFLEASPLRPKDFGEMDGKCVCFTSFPFRLLVFFLLLLQKLGGLDDWNLIKSCWKTTF